MHQANRDLQRHLLGQAWTGVTDGTFTHPVWKFARPHVLTGNAWANVPSVVPFGHTFSNARGTDDVIGDRAYGKTNERQEDRCEYIVPARTSHFASAGHNGREQELERDPWDVEDRGHHARLHLLDNDIPKTYALKFVCELVNLAESIDDPAIAEPAVDGVLQAPIRRGAKQEAIGKFNIVSYIRETNQFINLDHGRGAGSPEVAAESPTAATT